MKYIAIITSSLGCITSLALAILTGQLGWTCATIWAASCFVKDLKTLNNQ